jgi:hypothetical protein
MHPTMREAIVRENRRELERSLRYAHHRRELELAEPPPPEPVLLRLSAVGDDEALARLAALESRPAPRGQHVVAEVGGVVVAALPLGSGSLLADPFRRTTQIVPLLELRAKQLADDRPRGRSRGVLRAVRSLSRA